MHATTKATTLPHPLTFHPYLFKLILTVYIRYLVQDADHTNTLSKDLTDLHGCADTK